MIKIISSYCADAIQRRRLAVVIPVPASFRVSIAAAFCVFCVAIASGRAFADAPVVLNPVPSASSGSIQVPPYVPIGKALVLPITGYSTNGRRLSFHVSSSFPALMARVRSGGPLLDLNVSSSTYSGDLIFQLFREFAPNAAEYVAGFAEAGKYDGTTFYRIADLAGSASESQPTSFIIQGGGFNSSASDSAGFTFDNEYAAPLIFAGRGQLAMANSDTASSGILRGSNGSQFFITEGAYSEANGGVMDGRPRFLDFRYTIFGQMTHGWDLLPQIAAAQTDTNSKPVSPITINSAKVIENYTTAGKDASSNPATLTYTDAVLLLSATQAGTANLTVTADDGEGNISAPVTFSVTAILDTINDPPFVEPIEPSGNPNITALFKPGVKRNVSYQIVDLERDYVLANASLISGSSTAPSTDGTATIPSPAYFFQAPKRNQVVVSPAKGFAGPLDLQVVATQFDMTGARRGYGSSGNFVGDNSASCSVPVGAHPMVFAPVVIGGTAGAALSGVSAGTFRIATVRATASDLSATINWGDGPADVTNPVVDLPANITAGTTSEPNTFSITGSHTYKKPGIYRVTVNVTDKTGLPSSSSGYHETFHAKSIISSGQINVFGRDLKITGRNSGNQVLATFTDGGADRQYAAEADWGDGTVSPATVKLLPGGLFEVTGSHSYTDPEHYATLIHVIRKDGTDAYGWGTATVSGFTGQQHLPPFSQAHLIGALAPISDKTVSGNQTYLHYYIIILNVGDKEYGGGTLRCYLSPDTTPAPLSPATSPLPSRYIPLKIGPKLASIAIPRLAPGGGVTYYFDQNYLSARNATPDAPAGTYLGDFRLYPPSGETASGYHVVADLGLFNDPISDNEPVDHAAIVGKINGVSVSPTTVSTDQRGTPASFTVVLDKPPGKDSSGKDATFSLPVYISGAGSITSPAADSHGNHTIVFDNTNWKQGVMITVGGIESSQRAFYIGFGSGTSTGILDGTTCSSFVTATVHSNVNYITTNLPNATSSPKIHTVVYNTPTDGSNVNASFNVVLGAVPEAPVTVTLTSSNTNEGMLSTPGGAPSSSVTLTFNPGDPTDYKTVNVTAEDGVPNFHATVDYKITFSAAVSADPEFNGLTATTITVSNEHGD